MPRQFIDLSIPLENDVVSDPPVFAPKIRYIDHQASVAQLCAFFPGLTSQDLPGGEAWAIEQVELITHNGTPLDCQSALKFDQESASNFDQDQSPF